MSHLDDASQRIAATLFAAFPEWRQFQLAEAPDVFAKRIEGSLIVRIPVPVQVSAPESGNWLLIDTCDGEVTVTFDRYHAHFSLEPDRNDAPKSVENLVAFLQSFVFEHLAIAVAMNGDQWLGTATFAPREINDVANQFSDPADRIYVRSWKGSFDRELFPGVRFVVKEVSN